MPKTKSKLTNPTSTFSPTILLILLISLVFGFLYLVAYIKSAKVPRYNLDSVAAEVDFDNETGEYDPQEVNGEYLGINTIAPAAEIDEQVPVLGESTEEKRIEVDLTNQRLYAFEGDRMVYNFLVSTGKWGRTPTGTFKIWSKFRYTKMSGGSKELRTYYYLPNVPYVMFFSNDQIAASRGFSLHGTYWHDNFGHPMSHGCVNMKTEEAELIYHWSTPSLTDGQRSTLATRENEGTTIYIYGVAPQE